MELQQTDGGEKILYLYGIIPVDQGTPFLEGCTLQKVIRSGVAGLVEAVSAQEFSSDALEEKLGRLEWVGALARRHQAVLEQALEQGPVVPARLCTLFNSADSLEQSIEEKEDWLLEMLERVRGREEWGLKVFLDEAQLRSGLGLTDPRIRTIEQNLVTAGPGLTFVLRKKGEAILAELASTRAEGVIDEVIDDLEALVVEVRYRPLLSEGAPGRTEPMAHNVAFLVETSNREAFQACLGERSVQLRTEGFLFETSGPWPPYTFCEEDEIFDESDDAELNCELEG